MSGARLDVLSVPVLTVRQPFATLLARGIKDVENRSWPTSRRGPLWVHAAVQPHPEPPADLLDLPYPTGVLLGLVEVVGCTRSASSPWAKPGMWHWHVRALLLLDEPVPVSGRQGLWTLPPSVASRLADQM
jgi:hypothetical protein